MPILILYGVPLDTDTWELEDLVKDLRKTVVPLPELELTPDKVSVFLPANHDFGSELGEELILIVEGLFTKPERTHDVLQSWAAYLKNVLTAFATKNVPGCRLVEVLVKQFDSDLGAFASQEIE